MICENCLYNKNCQFLLKHKENKEVEGCTAFEDKSEWIHLPVKVGEQVFVVYAEEIQHTDVSSIKIESEDDHFVFITKCMVAWGGARFEEFILGKTVFLTREEAKKALDKQ